MSAARWIVVIPVKPAEVGKSRLVDGIARDPELVRALALDTIAAAVAAERVREVVVVTADARMPALLAGRAGIRVVAEDAPRGIAAALEAGLADAGESSPRAALLGDLPSLRPDDLDEALAAADAVDGGFVPDREGTGTALVTAAPGVAWRAAFGSGSAARHAALGLAPLAVSAGSRLRVDVDTPQQLAEAVHLGVGPATRRALAVGGVSAG